MTDASALTATVVFRPLPLPGRGPLVLATLVLDGRAVSSGRGQTRELAALAAVNDYCDAIHDAVGAAQRVEWDTATVATRVG